MTQTFTREQDFETALIETLTQHGWEKEVLKQPTEQELIQNWANILYQNNNTQDRLNGVPPTEGEMQQLLEHIRELRTPVRLNGFINAGYASITRDSPDDPLHQGQLLPSSSSGVTRLLQGRVDTRLLGNHASLVAQLLGRTVEVMYYSLSMVCL